MFVLFLYFLISIFAGVPLVYELDDDLRPIKHKDSISPLSGHYLGDQNEIKNRIDAVVNQTAKASNPKKLLFVVHRLTIAKDSLDTFQKVFGKSKTMGLYSGQKRELDCDFVFSTIQTISKSSHLENFAKDHFDYIIIDETHRSGADSYLRLLDYFEPKFL